MTPRDFKTTWTNEGETLSPFDPNRLKSLGLKKGTIDFLSIAGLPDDAAPFLSFDQDSDEDAICRLSDQYDFLPRFLKHYISIGSDGSGNPIAIDTENRDQIKWIDHENDFADRYMNGSISQLASFLVIYRDFVFTVLREKGEDAILDSNFSDQHYETLKQRMLAVDPEALNKNGFWNEELEMLLVNREYFLNEK